MMDWIKVLYNRTKEIINIYTKIFIIVMFLNQLLFFGLCLNPICLIAALPHVLLITVLIGSWIHRPTWLKVKETLTFVRDSYEVVRGQIIKNQKNKKEKKLFTGNIHLFVTQNQSKGEEDFETMLLRYRKVKIVSKTRLNNKYGSKSLLNAINSVKHKFNAGDIIAIVRGGGDTSDVQFDSYRDNETCIEVKNLTELFGVVTVSGIGHATDNFLIEKFVNFAQITPTDAAFQIAFLVDDKSW